MDTKKVLAAALFAADKHKNQRRKGASAAPYINHPLAVAVLLTSAWADEHTVVAGILHDTLEDTDTTVQELLSAFGPIVAKVVQEVTDDKSLPKDERKRLQVEHAAKLSKSAKLLKLADKISNVQDVLDDPPDWPLERKREYVDWASRVVYAMGPVNAWLEKKFHDLVKRAAEELK